jgi:hypothetical protein
MFCPAIVLHLFSNCNASILPSDGKTAETQQQEEQEEDSQDLPGQAPPSEESSADDDMDTDEVNIMEPRKGDKVEIRDGNNNKVGVTMVLDPQPRHPAKWGAKKWPKEARVNDYIEVRGGACPDGVDEAFCLQVAEGWEDEELWKTVRKNAPYIQWPGILTSDWTHFEENMTPADLLHLESFLIENQYLHGYTTQHTQKKTNIHVTSHSHRYTSGGKKNKSTSAKKPPAKKKKTR